MATGDDTPNLGDDFIRPGEPGFTSFPKHLPEDCVSYTIHVLDNSINPASTLRSRLVEIQKSATALARSHLKDYIWQRESFNLVLSPNTLDVSWASNNPSSKPSSSNGAKGSKEVPDERLHLSGSTNFGDNIADEWVIVFLLRELSKTFEDAWVRVWDADGEFLLAEAAQKLPKWVNPEIADHRVWINRGRLLIIPRSLSPQLASSSSVSPKSKAPKHPLQLPRQLTLSYALDLLQKHPTSSLLHDSSIEAEAFQRIQNYPADIKLSMHTSHLHVPRKLAYVLHRCPSHISPAIEAFYLRDPIALKPLSENASQQDLYFGPEDCVKMSVKFPRVGFAQLRGQEFPPPKAWKAFVSDSADDLTTRQKKEISMRLCCGFEMLMQDHKNKDERPVREIELLLEDLENGDEQLPTDQEIETWDKQDDSESWLDVDFSEFEKKLSGHGIGADKAENDDMWGFKDKATEERTRMLMERLLSLVADEEEGQASEDDEMDFDDDDDGSENGDFNIDDDDDPLPQPFDDTQFKEMKKKLGLRSDSDWDAGSDNRIEELGSDEDEGDDPSTETQKLQKVMADMEAELREAGFFEQ